jgi:hypothetical protein
MMRVLILSGIMLLYLNVAGQPTVIPLYKGVAPGSEKWTYTEQIYNAGTENTYVANVSRPTLTVYQPDSTVRSARTAVIVCPGGGF